MNPIRYKLKTAKTDTSGLAPVFLVFEYNSAKFHYYTKEKCKPDQWDADKMRFRRNFPGWQLANEHLEALTDKLRTAYRTAINQQQPVTNDLLRIALGGPDGVSAKQDLCTLFDEWLAARAPQLKKATVVSNRTTSVWLHRYCDRVGSIRVNAYTDAVHTALLSYLLDHLAPASISNVCKNLITFFTYCRETLHLQLSPCHANIKKQSVIGDRVYLTDSELQQLETAVLPPHLDRVRDAFLFQCYTGLRYSDLHKLETRNVEQRTGYSVICIVPTKSVSSQSARIKRIEIPLLPQAIELINRYASDRKLLPVLSNQRMNDYIKEVGKSANINAASDRIEYKHGIPSLVACEKWERLSTHVARHTFATLSLSKGVPLEVVSKALGHTDLKTTMIYAKVVDEYKNQAILSAWLPRQTS